MSSARREPLSTPTAPPSAPGSLAPDVDPLPALLHDVRGAATAIEALAGLVGDDTPALSPASRGLLDMIQARAEQLAATCEAVALLKERPSGWLPLATILDQSTRRLQKFLRRGGLGLKSVGEIPDMDIEARPLGVLLQSVLVTAVNARATSLAGTVLLEVLVVNGSPRIVLELSGPGWGPASLEAVQALASGAGDGLPARHACPASLASARALRRLGGTMRAALGDECLRVSLDLQVPQPVRLAEVRP